MLSVGIIFAYIVMWFILRVVLVVFTDAFSVIFLHELIIKAFLSTIGGTYFYHVITGLIPLSLHVGILFICMPFFDLSLMGVCLLIVSVLVYIFQ